MSEAQTKNSTINAKKAYRYSEAEKKKIIDKISSLIKAGKSVHNAVKKAGVSYASYADWKERLEREHPKRAYTKKKSALESMMVSLDQDAPLVILFGKPQDVNNALQQLTSVLKG